MPNSGLNKDLKKTSPFTFMKALLGNKKASVLLNPALLSTVLLLGIRVQFMLDEELDVT